MEIKKTLKKVLGYTILSTMVIGSGYATYLVAKDNQRRQEIRVARAINEGIYKANPSKLYTADLNEDGKSDYVVVSNDGAYRTIFLQQEDGTYKRLDEVKAEKQAEALSPIEKK